MSTPVVCNTLVPGSTRSCSGLFVDIRDHHCQDTSAEISVRSTGFRDRRLPHPPKPSVPCEVLGDSTTYPLPNSVCEFRTKIENTGRLRGTILQLRRCADKQRRAVRSWSSEKRFNSRGTQAARSDRLQHFPEQCGHSPPLRPTRTRAISRGQRLPECRWRSARAPGSHSIPIFYMSVRFPPALLVPSALPLRLFRYRPLATYMLPFHELLTQ